MASLPRFRRRAPPVERMPSWRRLASSVVIAATIAGSNLSVPVRAASAPVRIYAAGSLRTAIAGLVTASGFPQEAFAQPVFGPAGLLADRLLKTEKADLFASADVAHALRVAEASPHGLVIPFARNRMCVVSRAAQHLTATNVLDRLLAPDLRLATSTPGADPGGDYAMAIFDKADVLRKGAGKTLREKAMRLLGGPGALLPVPGHSAAASIFLADRADALITYCSGAKALLRDVDGLARLPLPEELEPHPVYGLALLTDNADAARFALFVLSTKGQEILASHGFQPIAARTP